MAKLNEIINNPYVKFFLVVAAILIAFFAWIFPRKEYKEIKIGLISNLPIINVSENIDKKDLVFYYQNNQIKNLTYLKIRFKNTGTSPLVKQNFVRDLQIILPEGVKIISWSLAPKGILNISQLNENIFSLNSDLFNPRDTVDLEAMVDANDVQLLLPGIKVDGRIFGVNDLQIKEQQILSEEEEQSSQKRILIGFLVALIIATLLSALPYFSEGKDRKISRFFKSFIPLFVVFMIYSLLIELLRNSSSSGFRLFVK